jgi:glycosyltransferase involved in cell wall biosynthesis
MPSDKTIPVSVIVLTQDEEINIRECLQSLTTFSEVIVVDSGSTDLTIPIIENEFAQVRLLHHDFEDFGAQRNWAIDHALPCNPWILFFDADERMTEECRQNIERAVCSSDSYVGYYLTYRNYFLGRPIVRCTLYPTWQLRLFRFGQVRFRAEGHGQREVTDGPLGYLKAPYDHFGFSHGVSHWIARHNRYSSEEAKLVLRLKNEPLGLRDLLSTSSIERRRCLKRLAARIGFRPFFRFVYLYVFRLGLLEGRAGLLFCLMRCAQEIHISTKIAELNQAAGNKLDRANNDRTVPCTTSPYETTY